MENQKLPSEPPTQHLVPRPEKQLFDSAMGGLARGNELYHINDLPWNQLPDHATIVDVGSGTGEPRLVVG